MYWLLDYAEQESLRQRMIGLQTSIAGNQQRDQSEQLFPFIGRKSRNIARTLIENLTKEGDVVVFCDGEYIVLKDETLKREKLIKEKMNKLFRRN